MSFVSFLRISGFRSLTDSMVKGEKLEFCPGLREGEESVAVLKLIIRASPCSLNKGCVAVLPDADGVYEGKASVSDPFVDWPSVVKAI